MATRETVIVTGIAGNLGLRLLPLLSEFEVVGVDMRAPTSVSLKAFCKADLGEEASCHQLVELIRDTAATAIVHLAFVIDPQRTGVLDVKRMWQINVAGTARVMEAISEINRRGGTRVRKFIFPSSVSAYGSETNGPVKEDAPLKAHTLPYAIHKRESDDVVRYRSDMMGDCATYILRPHIFTGASMQNYLVGALRGTPTGTGELGKKWRAEGRRLPLMLPFGDEYLRKEYQFVHVDDMARLISFILRRQDKPGEQIILNVAGRGPALTLQRCAEIANAKVVRLPKFLCRHVLQYLWNRGISAIPPDALPYMIGSYTMNTAKLRSFLGSEYENVMRYTCEEALADSFRTEPETERPAAQTQPV